MRQLISYVYSSSPALADIWVAGQTFVHVHEACVKQGVTVPIRVILSAGSLQRPATEIREQCVRVWRAKDGLAKMGVQIVPGGWAFGKRNVYGDQLEENFWADLAASAKAVTDAFGGPMVLEFEPYWRWKPRYVPFGSPDATKLIAAMQPFLTWARTFKPGFWLLPGRWQYVINMAMSLVVPRVVSLDETTYDVSRTGNWDSYDRLKAIEALTKRPWIPGFYLSSLRNRSFVAELVRRKIKTIWLYPDGDSDYRHFPEEGWAENEKGKET